MNPQYYVHKVGCQEAPTYRHDNLHSAIAESQRLARKHPNETFEVLKIIAISRIPTEITFWTDIHHP